MKLDHKLKGKLCLWQEIVFLFLLCSILLSQLAIDPVSQAEWKRDSLLLEGPSVMGKRSILLTCGLLIAHKKPSQGQRCGSLTSCIPQCVGHLEQTGFPAF